MLRTDAIEAVRKLGPAIPGLRMLVLHGSRAREDAHAASDWDFAFLADPGFDETALRSRLCAIVGTESVDVADLARAGGLLRYNVAKDGLALFESRPELFQDFCYDAASFWLDVARVVRTEHDAILDSLG